ncbi:hypothetical protein B0A49_08940 [Cryomyces minteri]|uniref:Vacuolar protein sorting-associated protein 54 n=1 Tax=Cryomyces minteri TaxID=331657 RepID=A0A4U0X3G4_9PEZI|nr:hypothetical protein B0A49_08940 [Cryomyces minteri]
MLIYIAAISTLLQPPTVRTGLLPHTVASAASGHKVPSTRDIPPVTLTNIPHLEPSAFKPYLSHIGSLYDAYQRAKTDAESAPSQLFRKDKQVPKDEFMKLLDRGLRQDHPGGSRHGSISVLSPPESPQQRRGSRRRSRRDPYMITPLSTIPNVYFEENFQLENPRTFDVVSERAEILKPPQGSLSDVNDSTNGSANAPRKALATNAILQEKLSWYMDTVEVHLISSISSASTSFFAALGSLRELQSEAADSVTRIRSLREDLQRVDQDMAIGGLEVVRMRRRRENLRKLTQAIEQLSRVVDGVTRCEGLINSGDFDGAADQMDSLERLIAGQPEPSGTAEATDPDIIDLRRLKALDGISEGISQLRSRIGKGFESRFLEALLADLRNHVQSVPHRDTFQRWATASQRSRGDHSRVHSGPPAYLKTNDELRSDLLASLNSLNRLNHSKPATAAFREAVVREMKGLIRQHLPSSNDDDAESITSVSTRGGRQLSQQDKSAILARNLRALDPEVAEELLINIYTAVGEALRRLGVQVKVLLDVTSSVDLPPGSSAITSPLRSPNLGNTDEYLNKPMPALPPLGVQLQEEMSQALDMSSLLGQAVDVAQTQITKILKVRAEQTVRLPLQRFLRYFTLNRLFADECEAVSGRSGAPLKGVINQQIGDFVHILGELEKQRIAQTLDSDLWEARDFREADDAFLARILQAMTSDPTLWTKGNMVWEEIDGSPDANGALTGNNSVNGTRKEKIRNAIIDEQKYVLVESATSALRGIDRFENLIVSIPSIASDVSSVLLDYLKLFHSRSCQLVLGAGATRSAGLKNITTKHLALASQALSFIIALIPYIREFVRRHSASSNPALAEFDKVKRAYQDHQSGIHDKLVDIMGGRASTHINVMKKIDFDAIVDQQVSPYMATLTKETSTLHRVLSKHLPETNVMMIMEPVFRSYREQWGKAFGGVVVKTEAGKARLLRDAQLFDTKLSKIDGSGDIGTYICNIVREKPVNIPAPATLGATNGRVSSDIPITSSIEPKPP